MTKLTVAIVEGNERYSDLANLTAKAYGHLIETDPDLMDGEGNCWVIAAVAHGVAQALGIKSKLRCGGVRHRASGDLRFSGGDHYWVVLDGHVILDSPSPEMIVVHRKGQNGHRYMPRVGKTAGLHELTNATRIALTEKRRSA